jgi:hypothetical protein
VEDSISLTSLVCREYPIPARERRRRIRSTGYGHEMRRRIVVPAFFATAASGVAYALLRLRRGASPRAGARDGAATPGEQQEYRCACGQVFLVSGTGRHRVYWLPDASPSDPVLSATCPSCERPLPRDQPASAATSP